MNNEKKIEIKTIMFHLISICVVVMIALLEYTKVIIREFAGIGLGLILVLNCTVLGFNIGYDYILDRIRNGEGIKNE